MSILKLKSVITTEAIIINKKELADETMMFTISKKVIPKTSDSYIGTCIGEMYKETEEDTDILSRSFSVKICVQGTFGSEVSKEISDNILHDEAFQQLLPHLRANMAALMASAGLTPFLIPNSMITNNEE